MSFNSEMTNLADAIRAKSGVAGKLSISGMTSAVNNIVINQGSDIDFSGVNVTADKMLSGTVAINAGGNKVTGNIQTVTATLSGNVTTVPAGYIAEKQTLTVPAVTPTLSDNVVTVPQGYISSKQTLTVAEAAAPTTSGNVVTVNKGYQSAQKKITVGTAKAAATYTPSTSDQSIAAGIYLSGKQTIKGDANLTAENIKSGVRIFAVTGTFEGSGGGGTGGSGTFDLAKVTEYTPHTPAMTAVTEVTVSGMGSFGDEEDFTAANGTYRVTAETAGETDWKKRVYKHESEDYYLFYYVDPEYSEDAYWQFGYDTDSGFLTLYSTENISSGVNDWENWDWGETFTLTTNVTETSIPETPMVLKGVMAKRYDIAENAWVIGSSEIVLDGVLNTPKVGGLYVIANGYTVGLAVASDSEAAIPTGFTSNTSMQGYVVNQSHGAGSYPDAYVVFNQIADRGDYAWYTGSIGVSTSNPAWFSIEVPEAFVPAGIFIMNEIQSPENFKTATFQGSNNGSSWTDLYTINNSPNTAGYKKEYPFECNTAYRYFRMLFTASHESGVSVQCFQIFKKSFIVENSADVDIPGLLFHASLSSSVSTAETGQELTENGDVDFGAVDGIACATFEGLQYITAPDSGFPSGTSARTIAFKFRKAENYDGDITIVSYGTASDSKRFSIGFSGDSFEVWGRLNTTSYDYGFEAERWYHCAVTFSAGTEALYVNGELAETQTHSGLNTMLNEMCIGACAEDHIDAFVGSIADVRVYDRVLTASEIQQLANG